MKKTILLGILMLALFVLIVGCKSEDTLTIDEGAQEQVQQPPLAPEPEPLPAQPSTPVEQPVVNTTPVNNTPAPGDEDVTAEEDKGLKFAAITFKDLKAFPTKVTIKTGGTVMWTNQDVNMLHIVGWSKMGIRAPGLKYGDSWNHTFTEPGEIIWYSTARPSIQGTIVIEE
jgi:plastocyanin